MPVGILLLGEHAADPVARHGRRLVPGDPRVWAVHGTGDAQRSTGGGDSGEEGEMPGHGRQQQPRPGTTADSGEMLWPAGDGEDDGKEENRRKEKKV